jgi:hypothetical protein
MIQYRVNHQQNTFEPVTTASDAIDINKDTKTCGWRQRREANDDEEEEVVVVVEEVVVSIRAASTAAVKHEAAEA